jgi:hypothetical protein
MRADSVSANTSPRLDNGRKKNGGSVRKNSHEGVEMDNTVTGAESPQAKGAQQKFYRISCQS